MKLSSKTIAALKMFIDLGEHYEEGFVSLIDVARRKDLSKKFLEQIVPIYKANGLLLCSRGKQGGYRLAKEAKDISLKDILSPSESLFQDEAIDDPVLWKTFEDFDKVASSYFRGITLASLVEKQKEEYANSYMI